MGSIDTIESLHRKVADLEAEVERLRAEHEQWSEWSNEVADLMPEQYDGDEAQEALILRAMGDFAAVRGVVQAVESRCEALEVQVAAVEALLPNTDEQFPIMPYQIRAALGATASEYLLIPRAALAAAAVPTQDEDARILAEFKAECDGQGVPYDVAGLVRHHRGNAALTASVDTYNELRAAASLPAPTERCTHGFFGPHEPSPGVKCPGLFAAKSLVEDER